MVLSNEEFNRAEICDIDFEKEQMSSLFQLRQSTHSFLIQCLADREIQKLIYSKPNYSSPKSAYGYNCAVIHSPHAWYHLNAVRGHGWNIKIHQPLDPKLKIVHVLAKQHSNKKQNHDDHLKTQQAREQIRQHEETIRILKEENAQVKQLQLKAILAREQMRQHEETIRILKEENAQVKQLHLKALKERNGMAENFNHNNITPNSHQLNELQQETRALKAVIESHKETIRILKDRNISLELFAIFRSVNDIQIQSSSENQINASNNQRIYQMQQEIRTMKSALQQKIETIRTLESQNLNLQARLREAVMHPPSSSLPPRASSTRDSGSQGCCIIM